MTGQPDEPDEARALLTALAQRLRAAAPPEAGMVHLYAEITAPDNGRFVLRHELAGDPTLRHAGQGRLPPDILDLCVTLRALLQHPEQGPWMQARFTLSAGGGFNARFGYPDAPLPELP